ncbi:hypothetical protein FQN60_017350, partial [Etheostoma spectabile]
MPVFLPSPCPSVSRPPASGLLRTVPPFSRPLLLSVAMEMLVKRGVEEDESVHSFVSRRLGKEMMMMMMKMMMMFYLSVIPRCTNVLLIFVDRHENCNHGSMRVTRSVPCLPVCVQLADIAVDSLCRGVFAGDCRKLSVRPTPAVPPGPLAQRSVTESWAQWSLSRGVESLPECIAEFLQRSGRAELRREAAVQHISPSASGWTISLEDGVLSADHIISALPAKALASILPPSCHPLIQLLQDISTVTVAVVNLEYEGSILPVSGFGHLLPSSEDQALLGVVYDSVPFPQHDRIQISESTLLTLGHGRVLQVMMGGAWFHEVFGPPDTVTEECLLARATEAVHCHLGVSSAPSWSRVTLQRDCIPQYYPGHFRKVESMRRFIRENNLSLSLIGASYDGVSVNDVIFNGRTAVEQLLGTG